MDVEYLEGMNGNLWVKRKSWLLKRYGLFVISIIAFMIIQNRALCLARSFASSPYNHRPVITTLKASSFQNGSQIVDVSESEIDQ